MKPYRRFIRINGELHTSPRFTKKGDAEKWYHHMRRKKQLLRDGLAIEEKNSVRFIDYARPWMKKRMAEYEPPTWMADDQRLRDYALPFLSEIPINQITTVHIKNLLLKISEEGFLKEGFKISKSTRTRVKALLSSLFSDALNEDPPLVIFNPALGIKFKEKRMGKKKPRALAGPAECLRFIQSAKEIGQVEFVVACIFLMSGIRKQELIALRWKSLNLKKSQIELSEKYQQATNKIVPGTKAGEDEGREVPISRQLVEVLTEHNKMTKYPTPEDFIVSKPNGRFYGGRDISRMIEKIREAADLEISAHGLRHTFGREFAANTGNIKALQAILGHASSATTDIYSNLAGDRIKGFNEAVSFETGVKESEE